MIQTLAVTADGGAVVSTDELGGTRLWPALDGSVEPFVVDLPPPRSLAIVREPRGYAIAAHDQAGGLIVQVVDKEARVVHRVVHAPEPPFKGLESAGAGFVAWRDDQVLVRVGADGAITERLAANAGEQIRSVAVRGDVAVAVIQPPTGEPRARRLQLAPKLAWGDTLPAELTMGARIALSPGGQRIATVVPKPDGRGAQLLRVFDTRTKARVLERGVTGTISFELLTDTQLAVASNGEVVWIDVATGIGASPEAVLHASTGDQIDGDVAGISGGRVIAAAHAELMIGDPNGTVQYLGYDVETPTTAAFGQKGQLVLGIGKRMLRLDEALNAVGTPKLGIDGDWVPAQLRWLGADDWLIMNASTRDGKIRVMHVDEATQEARLVAELPYGAAIWFESDSSLVTISPGEVAKVMHYDASKRALTPVSAMAAGFDAAHAQLFPVSPALAGGTSVVVSVSNQRTELRWVKDPSSLTEGARLTIDGTATAVSRAGHVFVWEYLDTGAQLVVYRLGKRLGTVRTDGVATVWPDPSGTSVALLGPNSVGVVGVDGAKRWTFAIQHVNDLVWSPEGDLVLITVNGVVRLDGASGKPRAARCGWAFGISGKPHSPPSRVEPVCTQLEP